MHTRNKTEKVNEVSVLERNDKQNIIILASNARDVIMLQVNIEVICACQLCVETMNMRIYLLNKKTIFIKKNCLQNIF